MLPLLSCAVKVTVTGPGGISVLPAVGLWVFTILEELVQLSVAVNCPNILGIVGVVQSTVVLGGQVVIVGGVASSMVTVKIHEDELPPPSCIFKASFVVPISLQVYMLLVKAKIRF